MVICTDYLMWTWSERRTTFCYRGTPFGCGTVVQNFSGTWRAEHNKWRFTSSVVICTRHGDMSQRLERSEMCSSPWLQRCRWTLWTVVGQVIDVDHHPNVGIEECLHMSPRALNRVRMSERRCTWGAKPSWNSVLKPWTVPDRRGSRACGSRCDPPTSSSATVL